MKNLILFLITLLALNAEADNVLRGDNIGRGRPQFGRCRSERGWLPINTRFFMPFCVDAEKGEKLIFGTYAGLPAEPLSVGATCMKCVVPGDDDYEQPLKTEDPQYPNRSCAQLGRGWFPINTHFNRPFCADELNGERVIFEGQCMKCVRPGDITPPSTYPPPPPPAENPARNITR